MPKYRVTSYFYGSTKREHWNTITAKTPQEAITKAKAQEKASHDKYNPHKRFKSNCTGWKAALVKNSSTKRKNESWEFPKIPMF